MAYTLQLLHFSDAEAGTLAPQTAPNFAALVDRFEDQYANSITLASGDLILPGPFLAAGTDPSVTAVLNAATGSTIVGSPQPGQVDLSIASLLGVQASALGNHEFDLGSNVLLSAFAPNAGYVGASFAYLSANLDFAPAGFPADPLNGRVVAGGQEAAAIKGRIAPSTIITENGEKIGIVGATTQLLENISSPSGAEVRGFPFGPGSNGETDNMAQLAAVLQPVIDGLIAQGVNKIVVVSHLQQLSNEIALAPLLNGVDIIVAGGSNTRLGDADDVAVAFPGHDATFEGTYPITASGLDGGTTLIVNTDGEYTYLGRLVVDFNDAGEIVGQSVVDNVSVNGAYAATTANVAAAYGIDEADVASVAFAAGTKGAAVKSLTDAVQNVITVKDGNVFGQSSVYLEGERIAVRSQETNLGNVSADANADALRDILGIADDIAVVSIKNGGGIRSFIGTVVDDGVGGVIKVGPDGGVSQLDVENALRFNNGLMAFDTTPQGLLNILNSNNATNAGNGGFIQVGGISFSFDPTKPLGSRVQDVALVDADGKITHVIADNGVVLAGGPSTITGVVLNFTANGGDGYNFKANADNFRFLLNDGTLSGPVDEALDFNVAPANILREQQTFAEYFAENFAETPYDVADTPPTLDTRIQNQAVRSDQVLNGEFAGVATGGDDVINTGFGNDTVNAQRGNDFIRTGDGNDVILGARGNDTLAGGRGSDVLEGGVDGDIFLIDQLSAGATDYITDYLVGTGDDLVFGAGIAVTKVEVGFEIAGNSFNGVDLRNSSAALDLKITLSSSAGEQTLFVLDTFNAGRVGYWEAELGVDLNYAPPVTGVSETIFQLIG